MIERGQRSSPGSSRQHRSAFAFDCRDGVSEASVANRAEACVAFNGTCHLAYRVQLVDGFGVFGPYGAGHKACSRGRRGLPLLVLAGGGSQWSSVRCRHAGVHDRTRVAGTRPRPAGSMREEQLVVAFPIDTRLGDGELAE